MIVHVLTEEYRGQENIDPRVFKDIEKAREVLRERAEEHGFIYCPDNKTWFESGGESIEESDSDYLENHDWRWCITSTDIEE